MMSHTFSTVVIGCPDTNEISAQALVAKVVLDLLERPLHQERYDRVENRNKPFQSEPRRYTYHCLFHNTHIYYSLWMRSSGKVLCADICQNYDKSLIAFQQSPHRLAHLLPHSYSCRHSHFSFPPSL